MPSILLEDDLPLVEAPSGPGERFVLGPEAPSPRPSLTRPGAELPEAYGTGRLFLTARDPHSLYATWDLTPEQQEGLAQRARGGRLVVRAYHDRVGATPAFELVAAADARSVFLTPVQADRRYVAELGLYDPAGMWHSIATSEEVSTPPAEPMRSESPVQFATVSLPPAEPSSAAPMPAPAPPAEPKPGPQESAPVPSAPTVAEARIEPPDRALRQEQVAAPAKVDTTMSAPRPIVDLLSPGPAWFEESAPVARGGSAPPAAARVEAHLAPTLVPDQAPPRQVAPPLNTPTPAPVMSQVPAPTWSQAQERALAEMIHTLALGVFGLSSLELEALLRRHLEEGITSPPGGELEAEAGAVPTALGAAGISSPGGLQPGLEKGFWLKVNAELVVYGATEPDAKVALGGRTIRLRPDGTFSYRFALPNGRYPLRIEARSADGTDLRAADLQFSRETQEEGEVGRHPQDPSLKAPDDQAALA